MHMKRLFCPAGLYGAVALMLAVLAAPALADNTTPKREVLTSGGEGGAYSKVGGEDPTGGSDPTPSNPGPAAGRGSSGDAVSVPGDTYVIHEPAPSAPTPRSGSLGGPITAQPNCFPTKYGYGNPGPGDDISSPPVIKTGPEAILPVIEPFIARIEVIAAEAAENPRWRWMVSYWFGRMWVAVRPLLTNPAAWDEFQRAIWALESGTAEVDAAEWIHTLLRWAQLQWHMGPRINVPLPGTPTPLLRAC